MADGRLLNSLPVKWVRKGRNLVTFASEKLDMTGMIMSNRSYAARIPKEMQESSKAETGKGPLNRYNGKSCQLPLLKDIQSTRFR